MLMMFAVLRSELVTRPTPDLSPLRTVPSKDAYVFAPELLFTYLKIQRVVKLALVLVIIIGCTQVYTDCIPTEREKTVRPLH